MGFAERQRMGKYNLKKIKMVDFINHIFLHDKKIKIVV
jgi:hypothetical protein